MNNSVNKYLSSHKIGQSQVIEQEKRKVWEDIKAEMPGFADFILLINKAFGKPGWVSYERK